MKSLEGRPLDAVVVSGDVSLRWDEAGFKALHETLEPIWQSGVSTAQVVVVPGNHDVRSGSPPASIERYEFFLDHVRSAGFVTPLLEGIDIDPGTPSGHDPILAFPTGDVIIVPLNSANWCVSKQELPAATETYLEKLAAAAGSDPNAAAAVKDLDTLRRHDVARVSQAQILALQDKLTAFPLPSDGGPVRVGVIHHQLLPVSPLEEFKAFESITNLGQVREFLSAQQFGLVLHGHKHQGAFYVDAAGWTGGQRGTPYAVSSAATVWRGGVATEFARVVELRTDRPAARRLRVFSLPPTIAGGDMGEPSCVGVHPARTAQGRPPNSCWIGGRTVDDVYERLIEALTDAGEELRHVYCEIEDGATAIRLPSRYPALDGVADPNAWLNEIVGWWQNPSPGLDGQARRFNHGQRVRSLSGRDQVDVVVQALAADQHTTRAIIQLIDQSKDDLGDALERVPSFFSLHFLIHDGLLDCVGYFRKQQIPMWWPVNVAEIATLQAEVAGKLRQADIDVRIGRIATFSAVAVNGTRRPRVVVPAIDRSAQEDPAVIWATSYDLFLGNKEPARTQVEAWLTDWSPTGEVEPDGTTVAVAGLEVLATATEMFAEKAASDEGRALARVLRRLARTNAKYSKTADEPQEPSKRALDYATWQTEVREAFEEIANFLNAILST